MSTVMNDRDVLLQAASPRYNIESDNPPVVLVTATAQVFRLAAGSTTPSSTTLTAKLLNMPSSATVTWSASGASVTPSGNTATVTGASMGGTSATITASITYLGVTYTGTATLSKVSDGSNGSNGSDGTSGTRGTVNIAQGGYTSWSDSVANSAIVSATGTSPINRDVVTLYGTGYSSSRFYQSGAWYVLDAYINGNMLVTGTFSASQIYGGMLDSIVIRSGTGDTPNGRAFEVNSSGGVFADGITVGSLTASNGLLTSASPASISATTFKNAPAVVGDVSFFNNFSDGHGLRGINYSGGTTPSGIVGTMNGYAFYDESGGYGPFTGGHDVLLPKESTSVLGDILVDVRCVARNGLSNTIFEVVTSSEERQRTAIGVLVRLNGPLAGMRPAVFIDEMYAGVDPTGNRTHNRATTAAYTENKDDYDLGVVNALGEGQINVCGAGGNIQAGDYIVTSSIPGKGMRQADDVLRNYTVAKAREDVVFSSPSEIKLVACIYLCG